MVDLHVHSLCSDGTLSPTQLVDYACEKGLSAFALTDHDTVAGLQQAIDYAETLRSENENTGKIIPEIIPGVELSTEYGNKDVHIVGLYIDYKNEEFAEYLQNFINARDERNRKMCRLLTEGGFAITYEELCEAFPGSVITRAHYAKLMMKKGYIKSIKEGFDKYLGDACPYFVPREKVTPAQAVDLILKADGIPVLAHPILYKLEPHKLDQLVSELKSHGLIGIEAIYSSYDPSDERQIRRLAKKYHLLISGGSDFHGENKPGLDLATGYGHLYIPDEVKTNLEKVRCNLLFSDMDGTLLRNDSTISDAMKTALTNMHKKGHRLILSSGRPLPSILEVVENSDLHFKGALIMAYNGALVYDFDSKSNILTKAISMEDCRKLVELADAEGLHIHGYSKEGVVCRKKNEELTFYTKRIHLPLICVPNIADALPNGSCKMQCISLTDHEALERFRQKATPLFDGRIHMIFSNEYYLEILPTDASKGSAIQYVTDYLSFPHSHTFACGDAENDISMLKAAHIGVAMQNATAAVKEAADIVTQKTNEEDGLLEIIDQYFH